MTNRQDFQGHQMDGHDQRAIPLRVPEQMPVSSVTDGDAIEPMFMQTDDQHECQF